MRIHWYPGHMAKAKRLIAESLKMVDMVIELLDARIPRSSTNPDFEAMFADKIKIVVLNKKDYSDAEVSKAWLSWFETLGVRAIMLNSLDRSDIRKLKELIFALAENKRNEIKQKKGINKTIRAMVIGIPNVGKSTLINSLAGSAKTKTGDRPGVTKAKQWVRIHPFVELLDTPGLLWPRLDDERTALHLAYTGAIKEEILDVEEIAHFLLEELKASYPDALKARYFLEDLQGNGFEILERICIRRGWLQSEGLPDTQRGAKQVLDEFKSGKLGPMSLEYPPEA